MQPQIGGFTDLSSPPFSSYSLGVTEYALASTSTLCKRHFEKMVATSCFNFILFLFLFNCAYRNMQRFL